MFFAAANFSEAARNCPSSETLAASRAFGLPDHADCFSSIGATVRLVRHQIEALPTNLDCKTDWRNANGPDFVSPANHHSKPFAGLFRPEAESPCKGGVTSVELPFNDFNDLYILLPQPPFDFRNE